MQQRGPVMWCLTPAVFPAANGYVSSALRVAIGSGGFWHTPGEDDVYIDEEFDSALLEFLKAGDIEGMATSAGLQKKSTTDAASAWAPTDAPLCAIDVASAAPAAQ